MIDKSQNGESIILQELFNKLGILAGFYLDIGAGDGVELSNTYYFDQLGWYGFKIDGDNKGNKDVIEMWITLDNISDIIQTCAGHHINLLDIDIDGNDYWILDALLESIKPDVIIYEVNSQLPLDKALVMPYEADRHWDGSTYFGFSFMAGEKLMQKHGYSIYTVVNKQNVIAVRKDLNVKPLEYKVGYTHAHRKTTKEFQEV